MCTDVDPFELPPTTQTRSLAQSGVVLVRLLPASGLRNEKLCELVLELGTPTDNDSVEVLPRQSPLLEHGAIYI